MSASRPPPPLISFFDFFAASALMTFNSKRKFLTQNKILYRMDGESSKFKISTLGDCLSPHLTSELSRINPSFWSLADMANYEVLVLNFSFNSTMDRQRNYNYQNFPNYEL